jgi:hypothetical protein
METHQPNMTNAYNIDVTFGADQNADINFKDILDWKNTVGIQGEERNTLMIAMGLLYQNDKRECLHFGVEGFTGSSKSFIVDNLLNYEKYDDILFPREVIVVASGGSEKSFVRNSQDFRNKLIIYIEEFQKLATKTELLENIKNLSENKNVRYALPNGERCEIDRGKSLIYCLAINNDYKKDAETTRRFIKLDTDISRELTLRVIGSKLDRGFFKEENVFIRDDRKLALKEHIRDCMAFRVTGPDFRNPFFSIKNANLFPLPDNNIRSYISYFTDLMNASAIFHFKQRIRHGNTVLIDLQDVYNVAIVFGDQFIRDIHGLPPYAEYVIEAFTHVSALSGTEAKRMGSLSSFSEEDTVVKATVGDIHRAVCERMGIMLDMETVRNIMQSLTDLNFLNMDSTGKRALYNRTQRVYQPLILDMSALLEHAKQNIKRKYPTLYDAWLEQNTKHLYNPLTGDVLDMLPVVKSGIADSKPPQKQQTQAIQSDVEVIEL